MRLLLRGGAVGLLTRLFASRLRVRLLRLANRLRIRLLRLANRLTTRLRRLLLLTIVIRRSIRVICRNLPHGRYRLLARHALTCSIHSLLRRLELRLGRGKFLSRT